MQLHENMFNSGLNIVVIARVGAGKADFHHPPQAHKYLQSPQTLKNLQNPYDVKKI